MSDKYIRKQVVFNRMSAWHMEIFNRITNESNNFSSYVMSILKEHFDRKQPLESVEISLEDQIEEIRKEIEKEQPTKAAPPSQKSTNFIPPKIFKK